VFYQGIFLGRQFLSRAWQNDWQLGRFIKSPRKGKALSFTAQSKPLQGHAFHRPKLNKLKSRRVADFCFPPLFTSRCSLVGLSGKQKNENMPSACSRRGRFQPVGLQAGG